MEKIKYSAPKKIFLNYAAVGPMNKFAHRAVVNFLDEYMRIGPPKIIEIYDQYSKKLSVEIAKLLNCLPEEITYVKNTTEGIVIAAESLPLKLGDEILLMGNEYPANLLPWLKKKKDGLCVELISGSDNHKAFLKLLKSIGKKTKVVSISWGQCYDGYMPDLNLLSEICKKNGTFLVVDAVHSVGAKHIDLKKIHIDILSCGGQKHIGALMGIGFMYVNKNTLPKLRDFKVGVRSVENFDSQGYNLKNSAERFQDGTQNIAGIVSLHAAIKHINQIGIKNIERKNIELLNSFKKILYKKNIPFIDYKNQANIISVKVPDSQELSAFLREQNIYIKAVKDVARLSFCHTSTSREFSIAAEYIKKWLLQNQVNIVKINLPARIIN